jgi:purine-binding chemotaxis protein CheW
MIPLVKFRVDDALFALHLEAVERVLWMVDLLPLPEAPGALCGLLNYHGQAVAVADVRRRMGWQPRSFDAGDRLIISRAGSRRLALAADTVDDVFEIPAGQIEPAPHLLPAASFLDGITSVDGQILLIHNLDRWLSDEETQYVGKVLESEAGQ